MPSKEERLVAEIPIHLKERVDADQQTNKEVVTEALEVYYGIAEGDGLQALRHREEQVKERLERLDDKEHAVQEEKEDLREDLERLQSQLQEFTADLDSYEDELDDLIARAEENENLNLVDDFVPVVETAKRHDTTPEKVIEDLKERSDLDDSRFTRGKGRVVR